MPWSLSDETPRWIGLDIGGANLKVSDGRGRSESVVFPLWQKSNELTDALGRLIQAFAGEGDASIAMTMTGELADCYETKAEGVRAIVAATVEAAQGRSIRVATTEDCWLSPEAAVAQPHTVAAANWRLAARLVARNRPEGEGLWIDVGSTTADVIPINAGKVDPQGLTDPDRLASGELIYTGVRRTPVCAVVDRLPYQGRDCPIAAEWFATTADAWLLLGDLSDDPGNRATADGRALTRPYAIDRLARCVGADRDSYSENDAQLAAEQIAAAQVKMIAGAISGHRPSWIVIGGEGEFLARRAVAASVAEVEPESISDRVGPLASRCLPAHAAAVLATIELGEPR